MSVWQRRYRPRDTVARWIAVTTLLAMLTALALNALFTTLAGVWARPPLTETGLMEKIATITRVIASVPVEQRERIAATVSDPGMTARWLEHHAQAGVPAVEDAQFNSGTPALRQLLDDPQALIEAYEPADWPRGQVGHYALLIQLRDGSWVAFSAARRAWGLEEWQRHLIIIALMLVSTVLVALVATRHLAQPLERFAEGARRFGVDFRSPPIIVQGPREIRQAIQAFNATQAQLQHFLDDRTHMLAAISHDLRAPLTRMRLRGEFVDDPEQQRKLFDDVDEMQAMVNAALAFFRDDARLEPARAFDLTELLHTVVDDFRDQGREVAFDGHQRQVYLGRPVGIKRLLVNLVGNAVQYASEPVVRMSASAESVDIRVQDRGPGIAIEHHEAVFTPFFRVEGSRNKHTGGVGLGLSAARATVLEHGGTLTLRNRRGGGLEVRVVLPMRV